MEECDVGPDGSPACTDECALSDMPQNEPAGIRSRLGTGHHSVATTRQGAAVGFVTRAVPSIPQGSGEGADPAALDAPPEVSLRLFAPNGEVIATAAATGAGRAATLADPAVAPLPGGFALAHTRVDLDGDELGVALQHFDLSGTPGSVLVANSHTFSSQSQPDLIWTGQSLVAAWVDDSQVTTAPDLRFRVFDAALKAQGEDRVLSASAGVEGAPTLSAWGADWAAAFRVGLSSDLQELHVVTGSGATWVVTGVGPGRADERPALVALDSERLLLAASGIEAGQAQDTPPRLHLALLHAGNAGSAIPLSSCLVAPESGTFFDAAVGQHEPLLLSENGDARLLFRSATVPGAKLDGSELGLGEELWERSVGAAGAMDCAGLQLGAPEPLPRAQALRAGDQETPRAALREGTRITAWEDHAARSLDQAQAGAVSPRLVIQLAPVETFCSTAIPCGEGEGHCESDAECLGALGCGLQNGADFALPPTVNACIPCGNGVVDPGEECDPGGLDADCSPRCRYPFCGDGNVDPGEQCDNGTAGIDSASCTQSCMTSTCGDGYVNPAANEECEPAESGVADANCDADCTLPLCGDLVLNTAAGEECELSEATCSSSCQLPACGGAGCASVSHRLHAIEPFDLEMKPQLRIDNPTGQAMDLSHYSLRYWFADAAPQGWDMEIWGGTAYVDTSQMSVVPLAAARDGATAYFHLPLQGMLEAGSAAATLDCSIRHSGWQGPTLDETDDYSYRETLTFSAHSGVTLYYDGKLVWGAEPPISGCGNGEVQPGEACDDGGESPTCNADCTLSSCGDGVLNTSAGEVCDPAGSPNCAADCSALIACAEPASCVHLEFARIANDAVDDADIKQRLNLINNSDTPLDLSQVTIRYYFSYEPTSSFAAACDYAQMGCSNVRALAASGPLPGGPAGATYYWDVGFTGGVLAAGQSTGEVQVRGNNTSYQSFNELDDYSYLDTTSPSVHTRVAVFLGGALLWGDTP